MLGIGLGLTSQRRRRAASSPDLLAGLLAFWRFDGDLTDNSGAGNTLAEVYPGVTYGAGVIGQGLAAQPASSGAYVTGSVDGVAGASVSGSAWSRSVWLRGGGGYSTVAARDPVDVSVFYATISDEYLSLYVSEFDGEGLPNALSYFAEVGLDPDWHHLVATCDGSGLVKAYYNGEEVDSLSIPNVGNSFSEWTSVFADQNQAHARIDLFGIWNRCLLPAEVITLYNGGAGFDPTA